jgi:hypothetical protein
MPRKKTPPGVYAVRVVVQDHNKATSTATLTLHLYAP